MVSGVLQDYTNYQYCCGISKSILTSLGHKQESAKPDAILIDRQTNEYVLAEWKMKSSDFTKNHHKDDVDILIVWIDDEKDRSKLPLETIALKAKALEYAIMKLNSLSSY